MFSNVLPNDQKQNNRDFLLSLPELVSLAENGDSSAQFLLARSLITGWKGCVRDSVAGQKWLEVAKSNENSLGGLCAQGYCYRYGWCNVKIKNLDKAKICYAKAAAQNYIPAISELADVLTSEAVTTTTSYHNNIPIKHTHKDNEKLVQAVSMLNHCAEAGYIDAIYDLSFCYSFGYGVPANTEESFRLLMIAAQDGHARAREAIAHRYKWGLGVKADIREKQRWCALAKAQGVDVTETEALTPQQQAENSCCRLM